MNSSRLRYVVVGAFGQLGRDLCATLPGEVLALSHSQADLTSLESLKGAICAFQPDAVINCAAYNLVDLAEKETEKAFAVNAWGIRNLALVCRELGCTLIHSSTDYVFGLDENRSTPYTENDAPGPVSVYGLSKLTGEYLLRSTWSKYFLIRTCGLYGHWGTGGKGTNFVETMLRLAQAGKPIRVVADQHCTPSNTLDIARAVAGLIPTQQYGLYHLTNSGSCTWYEFAKAILNRAGYSGQLSPITSAEYGAPARRPRYSVLASRAYTELGLPAPRAWQEALADYLGER